MQRPELGVPPLDDPAEGTMTKLNVVEVLREGQDTAAVLIVDDLRLDGHVGEEELRAAGATVLGVEDRGEGNGGLLGDWCQCVCRRGSD